MIRSVAIAIWLGLLVSSAPGEALLPPVRTGGTSEWDQVEEYVAARGIPEDATFRIYWNAGVRGMHAGQYTSAVDNLGRALGSSPAHPGAAFLYALALLARAEDRLAARNLRGAIGLFPSWNELDLHLEDFLAGGEDLARFRQRLQSLYDRTQGGPADPDVLALLGTIFFYEGDLPKARTALSQLAGQNPTDRIANHLLESTRFDAPAAEAPRPSPARGLRRDEDPFEAGSRYLYEGAYARAFERFAEVIARNPGHRFAWFEMSQALFALGRYPEAAASLRRGLARHPDWLRSPLRRRSFYANPAALDGQISALEDHIRDNPQDADAILLLGVQRLFDGAGEQAAYAAQLVERMRPGDEAAALLLEAGERTGGSGGEAPVAGPATRPDPMLLFRQGRHAEAYFRFLQDPPPTAPGSGEVAPRVAFLLSALHTDHRAHALILFDELLRGQKDPASLNLDVPGLYGNPAELDALLQELETAVQQDPDEVELTLLLGFLRFYSGQVPEARRVLQELRLRQPDLPYVGAFLGE